MDGCSRPQPKRSPPLPPIASTSAPTLASLLSCTAGARTSSTILMFTVSFRAAAYRRTASDGLPAGPASFCQFACSRACSGVCSCRVSKPCMLRASYSSLPISPLSFAGPKQVLAYLARYTHRVAIANSRLLDLDQTHVSFGWKDYRESGCHKSKVMRLEDRKSTRLNSSHDQISYAVFCLKKKKIKKERHIIHHKT